MKQFFSALILVFSFPLQSQALSFASDTTFLEASSKEKCVLQGGSWTEWYGEKYCTKLPHVFNDVPDTYPHAVAIGYVKNQGIVSGYDDGSFRPDATINRVELLKIIVEASGSNVPCFADAAQNLIDVDSQAWYYGYLLQGVCAGMVGGYPDNTFKPAQAVTVAEAAKIISNGFGDQVSTTNGAWYEGFVNNLASKKALPTTIGGVGSQLTRGQMAEIIYRLKARVTSLPSHTLNSLTGGVAAKANASAEVEVDAELDELFNDVFEEDMLDLDGLLDF